MSSIDTSDVRRLRELAREGRLASSVRTATPRQHAALAAAAYDLAWPVVFARVTRPVERRRGHWRCSIAISRLSPECVDGFHDDVEAVVADLLGNAKAHILDVEAWMAGRLNAATVDGNRRRRGLRGALQRPRMSGWLAAELGHDPWLAELALRVLDWVGVPDTAGSDLWPIDAWAVRRAAVKADPGEGTTRAVHADLDQVLAAMRRRPGWYADYVERPLGSKAAPVAAPPGDEVNDTRPLLPMTPGEIDDTRLTELAGAAVDAITERLRRGGEPRTVVIDVITTVFGAPTDALDRAPGTGTAWDETVSARLADPRTVDRIVAEALLILDAGVPLGLPVTVEQRP